jgi:hypothetical protein
MDIRDILKSNLLIVQYELLLTQTDKIMTQVRQFAGLEIPFDPTKEEWQSKRTLDNNKSYSPLDGKPLDISTIGKYKNVLKSRDLSRISSARKTIADLVGFDVFWDS